MRLHTHFLPELAGTELAEGTAVVIDVLRATTTIATALASGAARILPCQGVEEAKWLAHERHRGALLGGERSGLLIAGFDLGNSPSEYSDERVKGATIVFTTTNGTKALRHCDPAREVLLAAFVNCTAVGRELANQEVVHLVCAGTDGAITREDVLPAGALVALRQSQTANLKLNDQAALAADGWRAIERSLADGAELSDFLSNSQGGRNLLAIGRESDIQDASRIDRYDVVPRYDARSGEIRATDS